MLILKNVIAIGLVGKQNSKSKVVRLGSGFDLNNAVDKVVYGSTASVTIKTLQNKPDTITAGEIVIVWIGNVSENSSYGFQLLFHANGIGTNVYLRSKTLDNWSTWMKL